MKTSRKYSAERKAEILELLKPPFNKNYKELSKEEGIPPSTIYTWQQKAEKMGNQMRNTTKNKSKLSAQQQLTIIIETATLNESELSEYCRSHGLYPAEIQEWTKMIVHGFNQAKMVKQGEKTKVASAQKQIKILEKELKRKEKALAEAAALLVLRKKLAAFYGEDKEDD